MNSTHAVRILSVSYIIIVVSSKVKQCYVTVMTHASLSSSNILR